MRLTRSHCFPYPADSRRSFASTRPRPRQSAGSAPPALPVWNELISTWHPLYWKLATGTRWPTTMASRNIRLTCLRSADVTMS